ncbi:FHA domain-containing protein [Smaragdicoccus niigatensis]|uniref:FHA domain-containing protein n=1 Tax=Smaragdicoccus niigatensis TaxID=359359 RepID=UPI000376741C|nr:FHA domain-containing protein [Smaragdicoccus niigatensis]
MEGAILRYSDAGGRRRDVELEPTTPRLTIGRAATADIPLPWATEVSRLHAAVEWLGTHWAIVDDGLSRNGTFVNGERLTGRRRLTVGDRIRIASVTFSYHELSAESDDSTGLSSVRSPVARSLTEAQRAVLVALCRPYKHDSVFATPAPNQAIAEELFLSIDAVKTHLRTLFTKFGIEDLPQNQKRGRLAELALQSGVISEREL